MLSVLFFIICYATSILLFLGGVEDQIRPSDLDFSVFLPLAIADVVLIIGFILFERKIFKIRINVPLIIILLCLFIVNMIVIITTPLENTFEYIYNEEPGSILITIVNEYKVMYIICFFIMLLNIYISFNYLLFHVKFKKHFVWICLLGVIIGLFMVSYSYIVEWETYKYYLENISKTVRSFNPKSLTNNPNNYAAILLGAGFCCYGLFAATRKHIWWIVGMFFCINIVFPMSRICLILSVGMTLMIFLYAMIISWKGHEFRNLNLLFLLIIPLSIFISMCFTIPEMREYIENILFTNDRSINDRMPLWELSISLTQGVHRFVGNGHGYFNTAFTTINGKVKMPHNLYIQTYASLGLIGVGLFALLICFAIYKIIRFFKTNREASLISIIGLVIILSYYLVEG